MSRTHRNRNYNSCIYRNPKTKREIDQVNSILTDPELKEYNLGKKNRIEGRHIPTAYDDIVVSCRNETKWRLKNWEPGDNPWPPESTMGQWFDYIMEMKESELRD